MEYTPSEVDALEAIDAIPSSTPPRERSPVDWGPLPSELKARFLTRISNLFGLGMTRAQMLQMDQKISQCSCPAMRHQAAVAVQAKSYSRQKVAAASPSPPLSLPSPRRSARIAVRNSNSPPSHPVVIAPAKRTRTPRGHPAASPPHIKPSASRRAQKSGSPTQGAGRRRHKIDFS
ncbi:hypothetical protein N656DRAFT_166732 [Canariomyces notabilis]|uniref:Uncharacterized protein n=1 Tax=Canariomyces notabilis TaxID=2074819 RepID=A0AAN6TAM4_9PEZI|nr:hypothetical protein N656DRAFT_166732 [Canariomyces arenarius]